MILEWDNGLIYVYRHHEKFIHPYLCIYLGIYGDT